MKILGSVVAILAILIVAIVIVVKRTPQSQLAAAPATSTRTPAEQSEYAARLADCVACHSTAEGKPFAGGLKMGTPLGAIYATNITPDKDTGIGSYTLAEFDNAVRRGVARDGRRLYPAMPYPSYAKLTDADVKALYDYFMHDVLPVSQPNMKNELKWPLDMRWPLALWNVAFFKDETYQAKSGSDAIWNRGAYLVQGPGHCGSCHTPRGIAFQEKALDEKDDLYLSGALLDGWYASSLRGDAKTGLGSWSEQDIAELLKTGHNLHATVYGSMMDAFNNSTQFMTDEDLTAIAHYLKSLPGRRSEQPFVYDEKSATALNAGDLDAPGAGTYLKQCGFCHAADGRGHGKLLPPLAGNPTLLDAEPASVINIILNGAGRIVANGVPDSYRMPPYRVLLSDREIADVATFIRTSWGNDARPVTTQAVAELRGSTDSTSDRVIVLKMR